MADKKTIKGGLNIAKRLLAEPAPAYSPKALESTTARFADKIADANPKLTDAEVQKKALAQATKKLEWERVQKPALEKKYGALGKASYAESNPNKMQNTAEVVAERKRKANEFLDQPTEPWTPPPKELQAFDRNAIKDALEGFPDVEQSSFPRDKPARASTSHVEELYSDPENRALIEKQIKRGLPLGGETFYASLYPVKQAVLEAGMPAEKFDQWIHSLAPASARNSIMNEMAVGQFLRNMNARGIPLTEENVAREMAAYKEKFGVGLPLMPIHRQGVQNVIEGGVNLREQNLANIPTNYKIPTYGTQKAGDFAKSAVLDVHEAGGHTQGSRYHPYFNEQGGFGNTEYGIGEQGLLGIAEDLGIPGGMAQAGRWFGGGELTGLKSPRGDALDLLEKQVAFTLQQKGIQPNPANVRAEVLRQIETGEGDLLPWYRKEAMPDVRETGLQRAEGGEVDIDAADSRLNAAIEKRMAEGGGAFKKIQFMSDGGKTVKGAVQLGKRLLASGEEAPKVDRLSMSYKDVTKRVPEVADAIEKLNRGEITKAQYNDIVNLYKPVTPYSFVPKPASKEEAIGALRGDAAKSRYGMQSEYEPGARVGLRLDIPAYTNKGVWVNSIHDEKAKKVAYGPVSSVKNAELSASQAQSKKIAMGGEKAPYAKIKGEWNPMNEEEAVAKAQEYLNHPEWKQIGFDPERHSYFYDRATMEPITGADEVIQIGPLVLGKNPKYGKIDDFEYADGGKAVKGGLNIARRIFKTTDGYTFKEMPDGRVTNGDMTWDSVKEFKQDMPHSYQQGDELGQRRAGMESYGSPTGEQFMRELSEFMREPTPDQLFQRALNKQNAPKPQLSIVPPEKKADGGGAFKKLSFYGDGGITTSAGTFSPEELGVKASDLGISDKRWNDIKRNAADIAGEGKEQLEKEYRQLGRRGAKKDLAIRVGSQLLGGVPDLINLGLEGVDLVQSYIPALSRPESVLDTAGTGDRVPKFKLASEKPWLGSQQFLDKFKEAKLLGENEFPLTEFAAGFVAPAAAAGVVKKGKQAYKGAKALSETTSKRRGGLTAMSR